MYGRYRYNYQYMKPILFLIIALLGLSSCSMLYGPEREYKDITTFLLTEYQADLTNHTSCELRKIKYKKYIDSVVVLHPNIVRVEINERTSFSKNGIGSYYGCGYSIDMTDSLQFLHPSERTEKIHPLETNPNRYKDYFIIANHKVRYANCSLRFPIRYQGKTYTRGLGFSTQLLDELHPKIMFELDYIE